MKKRDREDKYSVHSDFVNANLQNNFLNIACILLFSLLSKNITYKAFRKLLHSKTENI